MVTVNSASSCSLLILWNMVCMTPGIMPLCDSSCPPIMVLVRPLVLPPYAIITPFSPINRMTKFSIFMMPLGFLPSTHHSVVVARCFITICHNTCVLTYNIIHRLVKFKWFVVIPCLCNCSVIFRLYSDCPVSKFFYHIISPLIKPFHKFLLRHRLHNTFYTSFAFLCQKKHYDVGWSTTPHGDFRADFS